MNVRSGLRSALLASAMVGALMVVSRPADAAIIYDTHDLNTVGELVPNAEDGTPNRPFGNRVGNTVTFAGTARGLDGVTVQWGTYHFNGAPDTSDQTITLTLYRPDGAPDLTGPGTNGNQPGTRIASASVTTSAFNTGNATGTLTFNFPSTVIPNTLVAIVESTLTGDANTQSGWIASSDFTPVVGSNPFGPRTWYGGAIGTFSSDNNWAFADSGNDPSVSSNLAFVFTAHDVPEPAAAALLGLCGVAGTMGRRRRGC